MSLLTILQVRMLFPINLLIQICPAGLSKGAVAGCFKGILLKIIIISLKEAVANS
jgi:hypothetical protein